MGKTCYIVMLDGQISRLLSVCTTPITGPRVRGHVLFSLKLHESNNDLSDVFAVSMFAFVVVVFRGGWGSV